MPKNVNLRIVELSVDHNVFREEIVCFSPTLWYSSHFHSTNYRCHLPRLHKIYPTNTVMHLNVVKPFPPRMGSVQIRAEGRFLISLGTQLQWRVIDQRFTWVACRVTAATDGSTISGRLVRNFVWTRPTLIDRFTTCLYVLCSSLQRTKTAQFLLSRLGGTIWNGQTWRNNRGNCSVATKTTRL